MLHPSRSGRQKLLLCRLVICTLALAAHAQTTAPAATVATVPHWTDAFTYHGLTSRSVGQHQIAGAASASSTTTTVRLTFRDIGPETGFSGSGSGFTFNRDTQQVILPSPQRIFRSLNRGSNWSPLDLAVSTSILEPAVTDGSYFVRQDPRDPQRLYAVTAHSGNLARSNDFGATWTQLGVEQRFDLAMHNFADIAVHEASPNVVLALRKSSNEFDGPALWRSEDGGATFTPQWNSGLPQEAFDPDTEEGCFPGYSTIATTPADPNIVYVAQPFGDIPHCPPAVHRSTDGGLTFERLDASQKGIIQVFPHPTRPEILFAQTSPFRSSIFRSMDGGASFRLVSGGLPDENFFVSFDRNNPALVYVAGRSGVFRSQDGGETYQPLGLTTEQLGTFASNVNVDPSNSNVIFVNTWNGNFKSVDGGATFRAINNGWKAAFIRTIAFDNASDPSLYLATDHGIFRTQTRGHRFEPVPGPSVLNDTRMLAVAPSNPDMILAVTSRPDGSAFAPVALYRTLDGGQSWTESTVDAGPVLPFAIAVDPQNSNNVYFVGSELDADGQTTSRGGFYRSVDAGATFEKTIRLNGNTLAIAPQHNGIFAGLGCAFGCWPLLKSVDGGLSFAPTSPLLDPFNSATVTGRLLIDPQNPDNLFLLGHFPTDFGTRQIMRSTDGGATLSPADAGLPSNACAELVMNPEDPARLYCWSTPTLAVTSDRGNTWSLVPAEEIAKLRGFGETSSMMLINPKRPKLLYLLGSSLLEVEIHSN